MEHKFAFYIDDTFFSEGFTIETFKNFKTLFEVSKQLQVKAYYNKSLFTKELRKIEEKGSMPKFKNTLKEYFKDFEAVEDFTLCEDKINVGFSKNEVKGKNQFNNAKETWAYINSKLPQRNFNSDYPKHGRKLENGTLLEAQTNSKTGEKESQLLTKNEESQTLLNSAIFDLRKRANFHVNFDYSENDTFILFPDENTKENTFHAFHLEEKLWKEKVPTSILKYFNK